MCQSVTYDLTSISCIRLLNDAMRDECQSHDFNTIPVWVRWSLTHTEDSGLFFPWHLKDKAVIQSANKEYNDMGDCGNKKWTAGLIAVLSLSN